MSRLFIGARSPFYITIIVFLIAATPMWSVAATVQDKLGEAILFEVSVLPDARRHVDFLEYPAYLAVALENNGFSPSMSSRIVILDDGALQIKNAVVRYSGRKGDIYRYEASVSWSTGVGETSFKVPVEVDITAMQGGKIRILIYPPLAKYFPQELTDRISVKIGSLANLGVQKKVLDYFDRLASERGVAGTLQLILIDAYNRSVSGGAAGGREPGDAEPLSDQLLLLITLVIWLVIVPLTILGQSLWQRVKNRRASR